MGIPGMRRLGKSPPVFPSAGLHYAQVLLLLIAPAILVFIYAWGYDHRSVGLFVHLLRADSFGMRRSSCVEAWVVRIDSQESWYLNSKKLAPTELPTLLGQQFGLRTDCVVFLDVASEVPYSVAIDAVELITKTEGRVVLLTPETKKIHVPQMSVNCARNNQESPRKEKVGNTKLPDGQV